MSLFGDRDIIDARARARRRNQKGSNAPFGEPWANTPIIHQSEVWCVKCRQPPAEYTGYRTREYWHGLAQCHGEQAQFTITRAQNEARGDKRIELFGGIVLPEPTKTLPAPRLLLMDRKSD